MGNKTHAINAHTHILFCVSSMSDTINFYRQGDAYGEFSNFYAAKFVCAKGLSWKTSEHYFQAMKFEGHHNHFEEVRAASTPGKSAKLGRSRAKPLRADWEEVKEQIMMDALRYKFTQNPELNELLLSTGNKQLVEHTRNDYYWGDGGDGSGKNRLGFCLMELREEFRKEYLEEKVIEKK